MFKILNIFSHKLYFHTVIVYLIDIINYSLTNSSNILPCKFCSICQIKDYLTIPIKDFDFDKNNNCNRYCISNSNCSNGIIRTKLKIVRV